MPVAYLPSPSTGVWHLGPFPLRAYALCIILGVVAAVVIGERRWVARGGRKGTVADLAAVVVPFGLLGARIYHVITSPGPYLDDPIAALYIWKGGLGIPGGLLGGTIAGIIYCRRKGIRAGALADAIAPGVAVAQAIGRLGNYFNQELFGRPTTLPWGLRIDPTNPDAVPGAVAYHPTFAYEALWNLGVAGVVIWADRKWQLGRGRAFALYLGLYAIGRSWVEALRIDDAHRFFGLRLNDYVAFAIMLGAAVYLYVRRGQPRETVVQASFPEPAEQDSDVASTL